MSTKIYEAMAAIMKATDAIGKDQKNAQQGFQYRGIDDVYNSMHRILAEHGVFMTPEVLEKTREERTNKNGTVLAFTALRIKYTFWAEDGSSVSCTVEGEGMDSGDKSSNKAMAVAHKYALLQTFCIPTAETKDPDAECHEVSARNHTRAAAKPPPANGFISREQKANIEALIAEVKADEAKFCDWLRKEYGIDFKTLADLPAQHYANAIQGLEAKRKAA